MNFQKVISGKTFFKLFFCWRLEGQWQKQDPDPNPDPDPLVRGMDLRIRIKTKMYWICNTKSGSGRIDIILADPDRDRHPGHAGTDRDPYPFQPKSSCFTPVLWIRIRGDPSVFCISLQSERPDPRASDAIPLHCVKLSVFGNYLNWGLYQRERSLWVLTYYFLSELPV